MLTSVLESQQGAAQCGEWGVVRAEDRTECSGTAAGKW